MSATAVEGMERERQRLANEDAAAWEEYAAACRRGLSPYQRRILFGMAMQTMIALARFEKAQCGVS